MKAVVSIFVYLCFCAIAISAPPRWDNQSGLASLIDKHRRLESISSPKIILVGGSNVSTGLDSFAIQTALRRPVVNMGLGASLGLRYMLEEIKYSLRPNDTVAIFPEYDFFCKTSKSESNAQLNGTTDLINLEQAFPGSLRWIGSIYLGSPDRFLGFIDDAQRFIILKMGFYRNIVTQLLLERKNETISSLFLPKNTIFTQRQNYNSLGDFIGHLTVVPPKKVEGNVLGYNEFHFNREAESVLDDFSATANSKQVKVVLIPPPLPTEQYNLRKPIVNYIFSRWAKLDAISLLASPVRYTFRADEMFDTPYHLNVYGRRRRTKLVIEDLTNFFNSQKLLSDKLTCERYR